MNDPTGTAVEPPAKQRWLALLATAGIITPSLDVMVIAWASAQRPNYSQVRQFVSELGDPGSPQGQLVSLWWVAFTLLLIPFVTAVFWGIKPNWLARTVAVMVLLFAVLSGAGTGLFPCDEDCDAATLAGQVHVVLSGIDFTACLFLPLVFGLGIAGQEAWRGYRSFSLVTFGVLLISISLFTCGHFWNGPIAMQTRPMLGLLQRIFTAAFYFWLVAVAGGLVRQNLDPAR